MLPLSLNSSLPNILHNRATGEITKKNNKPKTIGLIIFPSIKPNNIHNLLNGPSRSGLIIKEIKIIIQKLIKGENISMKDTGLSKREWNELMQAFDLKDKLI